MNVYALSDIHGDPEALNEALLLIEENLKEPETMVCFLGDYIHGYPGTLGSYEVLNRIIELQETYGEDKVAVLLGNHEDMVLNGRSTINSMDPNMDEDYELAGKDEYYINWLSYLPRYFIESNTIFVHAGIEEQYGDMWELETPDLTYTEKYPAETGQIEGLDMKVVAGHVYTSEIAGDPHFNDIFYDGASHYYIDGDTITTGHVNVLLVVTGEDKDKYYNVDESGTWPVLPYGEEVC